jgi:benzoyl-CoA reductase/2-hydroxyglutaryl-CoA dehydratase subunit BcrC/BadD/HgdB
MIGPAEEHLPANLCPLIKSTYGYSLRHANPFLEMADLIVAETTCDGKKKMYELLAQTRPVYVLELPQKPGDSDALEHWVAEIRKLKAELERRFGSEITEARLREAIHAMNRERQLRRQLADLMRSPAPPLTGRQLLTLKSSISGVSADLDQYAAALDVLSRAGQANGKSLSQNLFRGEIEREAPGQGGRRKRPGGVLEGTSRTFFADNAAPGVSQPIAAERGSEIDSKVRVLMTGVPIVHGAERVLDIIESCGGLVVAMDNCTGLKPIWEDVDESADDPIQALAQKYLRIPCSVMTPNDRRMDVLRQMVKLYQPQCIVDLIWQACLTYDVESHRVGQLAAELGLPFQRIETDYSPSDSARIRLRMEALFETVGQKEEVRSKK